SIYPLAKKVFNIRIRQEQPYKPAHVEATALRREHMTRAIDFFMDIYELLEIIKLRTGMYTSVETLSHIRSFINGYNFALKDNQDLNDSHNNFKGFHDFVARKYGFYESTAGWANMILAVELGHDPQKIIWSDFDAAATNVHHKNSIETFYQLLDEYRRT
ncbi:hypothetical protein, partial [Microbulbifer epialgicus]